MVMASKNKEKRIICFTRIPPPPLPPPDCIKLPMRRPMEGFASSASMLAKVRKFNPPNWMRTIKTNCPLKLRMDVISMTFSPVTDTAETDVNKASIKGILPSVFDISGMARRPAPTTAKLTKLITSMPAGFIPTLGRKRLALPTSSATNSKK